MEKEQRQGHWREWITLSKFQATGVIENGLMAKNKQKCLCHDLLYQFVLGKSFTFVAVCTWFEYCKHKSMISNQVLLIPSKADIWSRQKGKNARWGVRENDVLRALYSAISTARDTEEYDLNALFLSFSKVFKSFVDYRTLKSVTVFWKWAPMADRSFISKNDMAPTTMPRIYLAPKSASWGDSGPPPCSRNKHIGNKDLTWSSIFKP